ncbi:MAG: NAD(P)/FAD-dependent oxidoreductase [Pseudomonadota bacterium]
MDKLDCIVIGAGVVGLAVAARLSQNGLGVVVAEQHDLIGSETSSRNSEVIHAGIYYPAGSLKAKLCVAGKHLLYEHCETYHVPYSRCGKIIVATEAQQVDVVKSYIEKGKANGVPDLSWQNREWVAEREPEVHCLGAVHSPSTGIVDSHSYMVSLQGILEANDGWLALNTQVERVESSAGKNIVHTRDMSLEVGWVVNCGGLTAPELSRDMQSDHYPIPDSYYARGHYYAYSGRQPFSRLVYPVAVAGGLGVHVTLDLSGQVKFGPDVQWIDTIDYQFDNTRFDDFVQAIKSYYPDLDPDRLHPSYTGIRPKIAPAGAEFVDFRIDGPQVHGVPGRINLFAIESPGLTASLAIADMVLTEVCG